MNDIYCINLIHLIPARANARYRLNEWVVPKLYENEILIVAEQSLYENEII